MVDKSKYAPTDRSFDREVAVLSEVRHENVVELYATSRDGAKRLHGVRARRGRELLDVVSRAGSFTEKDAMVIIRQVLSAVAHMHARNIVHRDLKLENILLSDDGRAARQVD